MADLEFWFSVGSTYSYLTVMRIEAAAAAAGAKVAWRPFSVRAIMTEMNNIPFATKPVKAAYMWRDIERRAAGYGLPCRVPAPYPLQAFDLANRLAVLGREEGWCAAYVKAVYRHWFQAGEEASSPAVLDASLREAGQDPARALALAESAAVGAAYDAATEDARRHGIFGAPSFLVGDELFWGDDRLEEALAWCRR
jgi:2-hydroxychromene-2-carboxylate isomerase